MKQLTKEIIDEVSLEIGIAPDLPPLSVDIDLSYVYIDDRKTAFANIYAALKKHSNKNNLEFKHSR